MTVTRPDLAETAAITTPAAPVRAPGTTFSVTDTAQNVGAVASGASTTRYYLSLDGSEGRGRHAADREPGGAGVWPSGR